MDNLKLIELVQEKEYLYNKRLNEFRKVELKEATWKEIAKKLGVTDISVKKRWASLRDRFTKELRMRMMADEGRVLGKSFLTKEPWSLFDAMYFVKDFVKYRHYNDGSVMELKRSYEEDTYIESPYEELRDTNNIENDTEIEYLEQPPSKRLKEDNLEEHQNEEVEEQTYVERVGNPRIPNAQVLGISRIVIHKLNNLETILQNEAIENILSYLSAIERYQAGLTKVKPKLRF